MFFGVKMKWAYQGFAINNVLNMDNNNNNLNLATTGY